MTSKELHEQKIIPMRMELRKLEDEYAKLFRAECGEKINGKATCGNCAYSCVQSITDHNCCMGGKCTCCHDWCYRWCPENEISAFLRKYYHYDSSKYYRLEDMFGDDFIEECKEPHKAELVMRMLKLIAEFDDKHNDENWED